jgi:hypothetical protein
LTRVSDGIICFGRYYTALDKEGQEVLCTEAEIFNAPEKLVLPPDKFTNASFAYQQKGHFGHTEKPFARE